MRLEQGRVVVSDLGPLDLREFRLLGEHNLLNACGAVTAGLADNGDMPDRERLELALSGVTAPRSRLQPIGDIDGVSYIDDALASNPDGTVAACEGFPGQKDRPDLRRTRSRTRLLGARPGDRVELAATGRLLDG